MGLALIIENKGGGLYRARPLYDMTRLDATLAKLEGEETQYLALRAEMEKTIAALESDKTTAADAVDAVIKQWKDRIIKEMADKAPPLQPDPPDDPGTGQPWTDPDRAQEPPLLAAINAARTEAGKGTVSREADLDKAALRYLQNQAYLKTTGHLGADGSLPEGRVNLVGYLAEKVGEALCYGRSRPDSVAAGWKRNDKTVLYDADWTEVGLAHVHSANHPAAYLWCALFAKPGTPPPNIRVIESESQLQKKKEQDQATEDAKKAAEKLDKIEPPRTDPLTPDTLGKIVQEFGIVCAKLAAAEKALDQLAAEHLARATRLNELQARKTALENLNLEVWSCYWNDALAAGATVYTAEVPGFWLDAPVLKSARIYVGTVDERSVFFEERSWNIVQRVTPFDSKLAPALPLPASLAFYNLAMEPGHLTWRPAWRYGIIVDVSGDTCTVSVNETPARKMRDEAAMDLNAGLTLGANRTLVGVPIDYPPCNGSLFAPDDEVLIRFTGLDRTKPVVVGFRRAPRQCVRRISWEQIS